MTRSKDDEMVSSSSFTDAMTRTGTSFSQSSSSTLRRSDPNALRSGNETSDSLKKQSNTVDVEKAAGSEPRGGQVDPQARSRSLSSRNGAEDAEVYDAGAEVEGFQGGLQLTVTKSEGGYVYIEFAPDDPVDPVNWPKWKKIITLVATILFSTSTAVNGTGYTSLGDQITEQFNVSQTVFLVANMLYLSVGVAFTPLLLAPLSEIFGRLPIFLCSSLVFALLYIPAALTPSMAGVLIVRLLQGCVASVGNSMVGGTVSDIYSWSERGLPMSCFALSIYVGQSIGPVCASYTLTALSWRWVFAWQGFFGAFIFVMMALFLRETRGPVLLSRKAKQLTKTNDKGIRYRCQADDERVSFWQAVKISLARPAWWLISEPVVFSFSLWIGFLWGCIFLLLTSVPIVFEVYGWSDAQKSLPLLCLGVGGTIAWFLNFYQEKLYARAVAKAAPNKPAPEARLYFACLGGCLAPVGFFIFAWTGQAGVHPAAPLVGLVIFSAASFWIYLAVFTYLAECYEIYASSGLAAQSWLRNVLAGVFPLFAPAMYRNLSPSIASTILGVIATVLGLCPFLLFFFGERIRAKSPVVQALARQEEARRQKTERERQRQQRRAEREKLYK